MTLELILHSVFALQFLYFRYSILFFCFFWGKIWIVQKNIVLLQRNS